MAGPRTASSLRRCGHLIAGTIQARLGCQSTQEPRGSIDMAKELKPETENQSAPTADLGSDHLVALSLVGTVALPSPFPATGRIHVVRLPPPKGDAQAAPKFHIKIVQKINDSCIVTRFVDPSAVSMIRFQPATESKSTEQGPFSLDKAGVQKMVADQKWTVIDDRATYATEPHPHHTGVVHVPESQPVLLRYELSVPAATSLEQLMSRVARCPHSPPVSC